MYITSKIF